MKRPKRERRWWLEGRRVRVEYEHDLRGSPMRPPEAWPLSLALRPVQGPRWEMDWCSSHLDTALAVIELGDRAWLFLQRQNGEIEDLTFRVRLQSLRDDDKYP